MPYPYLAIDLGKIEHNARMVTTLCSQHGLTVTGVTKGVCGRPEIAEAMLRGGVAAIGESRIENIHRLKRAGIDAPIMQLRLPPLSGVEEVVLSADMSLNTELAVLEALSGAAMRHGRVHDVIIMVDMGDLREGVWPDDLVPFVREMLGFDGLRLTGIGTNLACFGGVVPSVEIMDRLVALAREIETEFNITLPWISGINSSGMDLLASGTLPERINHARIGEAILLGRETVHRNPLPGTYQDAFVLHTEILEHKTKPSAPIGQRGEDAFGQRPAFADRGRITRALVNLGREDVVVEGLTPRDGRLTVLGASSGYLALATGAAAAELSVGDEISFLPNYGALLAAMTSEYVHKRFYRDGRQVEGGN